MARQLRVEYDGAVYHVMSRGDRREPIFHDDSDRHGFLSALTEICGRTGWRVHAYVLMDNHYHWLLETPQANLVRGMQWFQSTYTIRFNRRHRLVGHLFQGRYKAVLIDPESPEYFATVADYIHLNPARARMVGGGRPLVAYPWSSLPLYGWPVGRRPPWLAVERLLGTLGWQDRVSHRRAFLRRLEERAMAGMAPGELKLLKRGWCIGDADFRGLLLDRIQGLREGKPELSPVSVAATDSDHAEMEAARLIARGLEALGLGRETLTQLPKSDPRKRLLGSLVRRRTVMSLRWIGRELAMGAESRVSRLCGKATDREFEMKLQALERQIIRMSRSKD